MQMVQDTDITVVGLFPCRTCRETPGLFIGRHGRSYPCYTGATARESTTWRIDGGITGTTSLTPGPESAVLTCPQLIPLSAVRASIIKGLS